MCVEQQQRMACLIGEVAEGLAKSQGERGSVILDRSSYL